MRAAETILPNVSERHIQLNSGNMLIAHAPDEFRLRHASRSKARQPNRCQIWNLAYDRLDDLHQDGFRKFRDQMIKEGPNRRQQSLPVRNERRNRGESRSKIQCRWSKARKCICSRHHPIGGAFGRRRRRDLPERSLRQTADMPVCAACGHPGSAHYTGAQREMGKCTVRKNSRRCMCSRYIPKTDEQRPTNHLLGRILRRPKGR